MIPRLPPTPPPDSNQRRLVPWVCLLLVTLVFAVFGQDVRHEFVNFDDEDYFSSNPHILAGLTGNSITWAFQIGYAANWHPLTWLSLMLDAQLFGSGPSGPHLTNVVLHAANVVLLFLLLRRLTGTLWPGAFVAAIFAIHPLHVESVAWVSERKDVLSGLFFLLTLLMYARYSDLSRVPQRKPKIFYALTLLFFAFGLMSKPMLVTLPFVLLLLDYWPLARFKNQSWMRLLLEKTPFFLFSAASCVITVLAQKDAITPTLALPLSVRIANCLSSYLIYLAQMFYPAGLAAFYPFPENGPPWWELVLASFLLAGVTIGTFAFRRSRPYLLVGWLWYLGMLIPVIGLLQVGGQAQADRYTYLPIIGVLIMLTWTAKDLFPTSRHRNQILGFGAIVVVAALMASASKQASYWRNSESLWNHTLACTSRNYVAHNDLGGALFKQGRVAEAIVQYQSALEINPRYVEAHNDLGVVLARQGQTTEAIGHYRTALEINPDYVEAHINLANSLAAAGQVNEAISHFQRALQLDPDNGEPHNDWGALLLRQGQNIEAMEHLQKAVEREPDNAEVQVNLGTALVTEGRTAEAIRCYQKALDLRPDYAKAHYNLANLFAAQGKPDEAINHYQKAVALMPDLIPARYRLGLALQSIGKFAAATVQFQKVLALNSRDIAALNDLAWLLATCPEDPVRDGSRSVALAMKAEQLSGGKSPEILDTLAAAYAETGQFPTAVQTAENALSLAIAQNKKLLVTALQNRLLVYQSNRPFRDANLISQPSNGSQ
jgi:tetratricopeptide (TPR) repeat protein